MLRTYYLLFIMCFGLKMYAVLYGCVVQVEFGGSTGRVAFDQFGRRRNYQLDVLEQRGDQEPAKVRSFPLSSTFIFFL